MTEAFTDYSSGTEVIVPSLATNTRTDVQTLTDPGARSLSTA